MHRYFITCRSTLLTLVVFAVMGSVSAQNIDSIMAARAHDSVKINALNDAAFQMVANEPEQAARIARRAALLAMATGRQTDYADCLNTIGWAYMLLGKYDSAHILLSQAKTYFQQKQLISNQVHAMINIASVYQAEDNDQAALTELLSAMQLAGASKETEYAIAEKMIGIIYRKQGYTNKAKEYLQKAIQDFQKLNKSNYKADALGSLGILYYDQQQYDSALYCYRLALSIYLRGGNLAGAALIYDDIAVVHYSRAEKTPIPSLDSALHYYEQAYTLFRKLNSAIDMTYERMSMASVLARKKNYPLAEKYLLETLPEVEQRRDLLSAQKGFLTLSEIYGATHQYEKAYAYLKKARTLRDTILANDKKQAIADMLARFETDKKDQAIQLLNTQNKFLTAQKKLAEQNLRKTRIIEVFAFAFALLIIALGSVLMNRSRIKQRLQSLQMRNRISNDLHDDVGSSLSSILLLSKLAADDKEHKQELVEKISNISEEVIDRIRDIIWSTNPRFDDGTNLRSKIMNHTAFLQQMPNVRADVYIDDQIKDVKLPMETRRNLFLIIKEAINNIVKHADATNISLSLQIKGRQLFLEISDDGTGFDTSTLSGGNGLRTMQTRVAECKGQITIKSTPGNGTLITTIIPIPKHSYLNDKISKLYEREG